MTNANSTRPTKREVTDVPNREEAHRIAAEWRKEGYRVGVSAKMGSNLSYTGLFVVSGILRKSER